MSRTYTRRHHTAPHRKRGAKLTNGHGALPSKPPLVRPQSARQIAIMDALRDGPSSAATILLRGQRGGALPETDTVADIAGTLAVLDAVGLVKKAGELWEAA
jgi:hypothetical protein